MRDSEELSKQEHPISLGIDPPDKHPQPDRQLLQENGLHMSPPEPVPDQERATGLVLSVSMADPALSSSVGGTPRCELFFNP